MFLRMNRSDKNAVASVVDECGNRSTVVVVDNKHHRRSKHYNKNQRFVLTNVTTHIVRTYGRGGRIILPRSSGGLAFAEALKKHGIQAQVS